MSACMTSMGTPWAASWDEAWGKRVAEEEVLLGRRICGGRLNSGEPCRMSAAHVNGRCGHHGGFDTTGGVPGNRNALRHGLYARGIQRCGPHCPMWAHCPLAGKDILALPEQHRPECSYEVQHYELAVEDALNDGERDPENAHLVALLAVMMMRAAAAMSVSPLWLTNAQGLADKVHPALEAFRRLSAEYRRYAFAGRQSSRSRRKAEVSARSLETTMAAEEDPPQERCEAGGAEEWNPTDPTDLTDGAAGANSGAAGDVQETSAGLAMPAAVTRCEWAETSVTQAREEYTRLSVQAKEERRRWGRACRATREKLAAAQQRLALAGTSGGLVATG